MLKRVIKKIFQKAGYELLKKSEQPVANATDPQLGFYLEEEAAAKIKVIKPNTMQSYVRLVTLYQQVVHCEKNNIAGSYVECGVWKGGAVGLMALANLKHGKERRHLHLFDAFDEICEPDATVDGKRAVDDVEYFSGRKQKATGELTPVKGIYDKIGGPGTIEENRELLEKKIGYNPSYIHYHKGWFQDTVPADAAAIGDIAVLRLDGDWYASTKICLEHLYPKVVKGGFVIIDDYGHYEGCKKAVDEYLEKTGERPFFIQVDYTCIYWIK